MWLNRLAPFPSSQNVSKFRSLTNASPPLLFFFMVSNFTDSDCKFLHFLIILLGKNNTFMSTIWQKESLYKFRVAIETIPPNQVLMLPHYMLSDAVASDQILHIISCIIVYAKFIRDGDEKYFGRSLAMY
uniref:Uncharacterized protein n=1 Tax=Ananas comosus var. bracteatus TaxID=296719 RepID=A0A6V7P572_ANACO|nr:unnamed protein product [Ananas comosus var. bracteatus]